MALLVALLSPLFAQADTIYLKNGRQIQGTNAVKQNGKVTFETAAGTMSVPESLVDRIVSGDPPIAPQTNSNSAAAELSMAPPSSSSADSASVLQSILRDGALDQQALAQIDARAATRAPDAHAALADGREHRVAIAVMEEVSALTGVLERADRVDAEHRLNLTKVISARRCSMPGARSVLRQTKSHCSSARPFCT